MAKSDPTIAAPITPRPTVALPVAQKLAPKFAASASACLPIESPRRMSAASAAVLIVVSDVWMIAAVLTPRTLIQVSAATEATAKMRSEEHTSELQSPCNLVCRLLLEKKKTQQ